MKQIKKSFLEGESPTSRSNPARTTWQLEDFKTNYVKNFQNIQSVNPIFIFHCSPCNRPSIVNDCNINDGWYINQIKQLKLVLLL